MFFAVVSCPPISVWDGYVVNNTDTTYNIEVNVQCEGNGSYAENRTESLHTCDERGEWHPEIQPCRGNNERYMNCTKNVLQHISMMTALQQAGVQ